MNTWVKINSKCGKILVTVFSVLAEVVVMCDFVAVFLDFNSQGIFIVVLTYRQGLWCKGITSWFAYMTINVSYLVLWRWMNAHFDHVYYFLLPRQN